MGVRAESAVFHINCEGCEYEVIESLGQDRLSTVSAIQISTHMVQASGRAMGAFPSFKTSVEESIFRYCKMHETLAKTHVLLYGAPWRHELWVRTRHAASKPSSSIA